MTHSRPSIPVFATTLLFVTSVRRWLDLRRFHASRCYRPLVLCVKISENPQYLHILFARMGCHYRRSARVWALVLGYLLLETTQHATAWGKNRIEPAEACADFAPGTGYPESAWTLDDCIEVWTQFSETMPQGQHRRLPYVDTWRDTAIELRRAGSPCLAASNPSGDGAGSSTIRHLASWIFAEEMGCDWVTPDWGKRHVGGGNGTVMYCHRTATVQEMDNPDPSDGQELHHCSVVDWLAYFQFDVPSVSLPDHGTVEVIQARVSPFSRRNNCAVRTTAEIPSRACPQKLVYNIININVGLLSCPYTPEYYALLLSPGYCKMLFDVLFGENRVFLENSNASGFFFTATAVDYTW